MEEGRLWSKERGQAIWHLNESHNANARTGLDSAAIAQEGQTQRIEFTHQKTGAFLEFDRSGGVRHLTGAESELSDAKKQAMAKALHEVIRKGLTNSEMPLNTTHLGGLKAYIDSFRLKKAA
ncbi:hypothetical protein HYV43_00095 [Candidatus Micrarchaeota archaeon]|nr:hypothetical protein [Candidatus Micrarchaeota archaeon]